MNDITWQLGAGNYTIMVTSMPNLIRKNKLINFIILFHSTDFRAKDAISYIDDLNTLRLIVGSFSTKNNRKNWSVVGSDITAGSSEYEARMFSEFSKYTVDAVGWSQ